MHRVLERIDQQLDGPLDLEALAAVAHFSAFHFHRLFAAWTGETLGSYLRRRRLEVAATRLLAQPRVPVTNIAFAVGFGSAEAFARAFKVRFACSPSSWRQQHSKRDQVKRKLDQAPLPTAGEDDRIEGNAAETVMKVEIVERRPVSIAYLRNIGPYGAPLQDFWRTRVAPWMAQSGLLERPRYGISHDDPNIVAPAQCRYHAGVEIAPDFTHLGHALKGLIPGGLYAAMSFEDTIARIESSWTALLRDWLPSSGYQLDGRPMFEYYPRGSQFDPASGVFDCQLCVPIMPL